MISSTLMLLLLLPASATIKQCGETPPPRFSPCRPSQTEINEIMALLKEGNRHHLEYLKASADESRFRTEDEAGREIDLEDWNDSRLEAERRKNRMESANQEALTKVGAYYGIRPSNLSGSIGDGLLKKGQAHWQPMMHEERDGIYSAIGTRHSDKNGSNTYSFKYEDSYRFKDPETGEETFRNTDSATLDMGATFVSIRVFQRAIKSNNPAVLATTLAFEAAKFDRLTETRWWAAGWRFKEHVANAALSEAIKAAKAVGINDEELEALETRQREAQYAARIGTWGGRLLNPGYTSLGESDENAKQYAKEESARDAIKRQQSELAKRLEDQRKDRAERRRKEEIEEEWREFHRTNPGAFRDAPNRSCGGEGTWTGGIFFPSPPCPSTPAQPARPQINPSPVIPAEPFPSVAPARPSPTFDKLGAINSLAQRGCGNSALPSSEELNNIWTRIAPIPKDSAASERMGLSGCQKSLFDKLMLAASGGGHSSMTVERFEALAAAARSEGQAVVPDDEPAPPRESVPWCLQAPGRRCIR